MDVAEAEARENLGDDVGLLVGKNRAVLVIVEIMAADVFGPLVPCHNEAGVEGRTDRGNVGVLTSENDVVNDQGVAADCS